jgi:hypothetical protein
MCGSVQITMTNPILERFDLSPTPHDVCNCSVGAALTDNVSSMLKF